MKATLSEMSKFVVLPGLPSGQDAQWSDMRAHLYLNQVLLFNFSPDKMGTRTHREILTLYKAIDLLLEGSLPALGDLLCQRLKALETALREGGWSTARHQELLPPAAASLTSPQEVDHVLRAEVRQQKLAEALQKRKPK
jgi:hypothetical protein